MHIVITHDTVKSIAFYCMEGGGVKRGGGGGGGGGAPHGLCSNE